MASYLSGNIAVGKLTKMIAGKATVSFANPTMASTASKLASSVINKTAAKTAVKMASLFTSFKVISPFIKTIASVRPPVSLPMVEQIQPAVTAAPSIPLPVEAPTVEEVQPVVTAAPSITSVPMTKFQLFLKTYFGL